MKDIKDNIHILILLSVILPSVAICITSCSASNNIPSNSSQIIPAIAPPYYSGNSVLPAEHPSRWPTELIGILGGIVGFVGGLTALISVLRPPKIIVSHMDHIGILVFEEGPAHLPHEERTTLTRFYLPIVLSNIAKKPGVITSLELRVRSEREDREYSFSWNTICREDAEGQPKPDKKPAPIPVPGFSCVERIIEFGSVEYIRWESKVYEFELLVEMGKNRILKSGSKFYFCPYLTQVWIWNDIPDNTTPRVEDCHICSKRTDYSGKWAAPYIPLWRKMMEPIAKRLGIKLS
jgi:hypothetical protein